MKKLYYQGNEILLQNNQHRLPSNLSKGAHDKKYIEAPDWELFNKFQEAAGGKIKLITIAPEWEG